MQLWIRSQDKYTLMKIEEIQICENPDGTWFMNAGLVLGKYKSKERALELLDEIQNILKPKFILQTQEIEKPITEFISTVEQIKDIKEISTYVYEMPKE